MASSYFHLSTKILQQCYSYLSTSFGFMIRLVFTFKDTSIQIPLVLPDIGTNDVSFNTGMVIENDGKQHTS